MEALANTKRMMNIWKDRRGQDLVEYALMAGFVAVAAGAMMGSVADQITPVFSKVLSVATAAINGGDQPSSTPGGVPTPANP